MNAWIDHRPFWRPAPDGQVDRYRDLPDGIRWTVRIYRWGILTYGLSGTVLACRWSGRWMDGKRFFFKPSSLWLRAWVRP